MLQQTIQVHFLEARGDFMRLFKVPYDMKHEEKRLYLCNVKSTYEESIAHFRFNNFSRLKFMPERPRRESADFKGFPHGQLGTIRLCGAHHNRGKTHDL